MIEVIAEIIRMFGEFVSYIAIGAISLFGIAIALMTFRDYKGER
jgi:hypothetical protein|tara:strand:- start:2651 stop:2782 length:132 start_codon:yes stop_codon:yes gene_type:complete